MKYIADGMWYDKKNIAFGMVIPRFKFRLPLKPHTSHLCLLSLFLYKM